MRIAIVACGQCTLPGEADLPESFEVSKLADISDLPLLELSAVVFVIGQSRKLPDWFGCEYLAGVSAFGVPVAVVLTPSSRLESVQPLIPEGLETCRFESSTGRVWGASVVSPDHEDLLSAHVRYCFRPKSAAVAEVFTPLMVKGRQDIWLAFAERGGSGAVHVQGEVTELLPWLSDRFEGSGEIAPVPAGAGAAGAAATMAADAAATVAAGAAATMAAGAPGRRESTVAGRAGAVAARGVSRVKAALQEQGKEQGARPRQSILSRVSRVVASLLVFRCPGLIRLALFFLLVSIAATRLPTWLRQSQIQSNKSQIKTSNGEQEKAMESDAEIVDPKRAVSGLEKLAGSSARLKWNDSAWSKHCDEAIRSNRWSDYKVVLADLQDCGRLEDEKLLMEAAFKSEARDVHRGLNEYVFIQSETLMCEAFCARRFDEAAARADMIIKWWGNPHCNWLNGEHHETVNGARKMAALCTLPAIIRTHQDLLDSLVENIRRGSRIRPRVDYDPSLAPVIDYLLIDVDYPKGSSDPGKAIAAWQKYREDYPDKVWKDEQRTLRPEALLNQAHRWSQRALKQCRESEAGADGMIAVDWKEADAFLETAADEYGKTHALYDDLLFLRFLVAGSSGNRERTARELSELFAIGNCDGLAMAVARSTGQTGVRYDKSVSIHSLVKGWMQNPGLKEGAAMSQSALKNLVPGLSADTHAAMRKDPLLEGGIFRGKSLEDLLAAIFISQVGPATRKEFMRVPAADTILPALPLVPYETF